MKLCEYRGYGYLMLLIILTYNRRRTRRVEGYLFVTAPAVTPIIVEVMDAMTRMSCGCSHPTLTARAHRSQLGTTEAHANSMDIQLLGELIFQLLSERKSQ